MKSDFFQISIPKGLRVISAFYFIIGLCFVITSIYIIFNPSSAKDILMEEGYGFLNKGSIIMGGIIFLFLGFFILLVSRGLWILKRWSRLSVLFLSFFGFLIGIANISVERLGIGLFYVLFNGIISAYLLFNQRARENFP